MIGAAIFCKERLGVARRGWMCSGVVGRGETWSDVSRCGRAERVGPWLTASKLPRGPRKAESLRAERKCGARRAATIPPTMPVSVRQSRRSATDQLAPLRYSGALSPRDYAASSPRRWGARFNLEREHFCLFGVDGAASFLIRGVEIT